MCRRKKSSLGEHAKHNDADDEKLEIRRQVPTLLQALNENLFDELITQITNRFADADKIIHKQKIRP